MPPSEAPADWNVELARSYRRPAELLADLGLPADLAGEGAGFPFLVTRAFASRMRQGDPADPLLRQVLPLAEESHPVPGFHGDPVGDLAARRGAGLLQKYRGRALLLVKTGCAAHCRYCFRRTYPYQEDRPASDFAEALAVLSGDASISELILSGGEPLLASDAELHRLFENLKELQALRTIRIHSRLPVFLPSRLDSGFLRLISAWSWRFRFVLVSHINHPRELSDFSREALRTAQQAGMTLLAQSVLLRGINDTADVLAELSCALFDQGVLPYYLHQLDRVRGSAHFEVADKTALALLETLRARLPGYLVPRLVREVPGQPSKTPI